MRAGAALDLGDKYQCTALMIAAHHGHTEVVQELVRGNAFLNLCDEDGNTALMWAARNGHTEVVQALVQAGAALDLRDNDGKTALMIAEASRHMGVAQALVRADDEALDHCRTNIFAVNQCGGTCYLAAVLNLAIKVPKLYEALRGYQILHAYLVKLRDEARLSLIHIYEPTSPLYISYGVFCL